MRTFHVSILVFFVGKRNTQKCTATATKFLPPIINNNILRSNCIGGLGKDSFAYIQSQYVLYNDHFFAQNQDFCFFCKYSHVKLFIIDSAIIISTHTEFFCSIEKSYNYLWIQSACTVTDNICIYHNHKMGMGGSWFVLDVHRRTLFGNKLEGKSSFDAFSSSWYTVIFSQHTDTFLQWTQQCLSHLTVNSTYVLPLEYKIRDFPKVLHITHIFYSNSMSACVLYPLSKYTQWQEGCHMPCHAYLE